MPHVVTVKAFLRWLMLEKAQASREIWQNYTKAEDKTAFIRESSKADNELRQWAMIEDEW